MLWNTAILVRPWLWLYIYIYDFSMCAESIYDRDAEGMYHMDAEYMYGMYTGDIWHWNCLKYLVSDHLQSNFSLSLCLQGRSLL
jgi:hypothetical protein